MVNIPMNTAGAVDRNSVVSINQHKIRGAKGRDTVLELNAAVKNNASASAAASSIASVPAAANVNNAPVRMHLPSLDNPVRKGQKLALEETSRLTRIKACMGWNVKNPACDLDISAFLLSGTKVISDDWFVFYGHPESPDKSTIFSSDGGEDRETVSIDFTKLNADVDKIVFVLTINEALEKRLNFSMIEDAYIRIIDSGSNKELVSFVMDEYYDNVTSMMIGEVYRHNGLWKFNAVGNGVARDLAGLCELYGVQVE